MKYEILTSTGWSDFQGVKKTERVGSIIITTNSCKTLETTPDHQVYTPYGFMSVDVLNEGDKIFTKDGYEVIHNIVEDKFCTKNFYDVLEVEKDHSYFTNGILSHNCEFLGSSGTLISGNKLKCLVPRTPVKEQHGLAIYEHPDKEKTYTIIADVSRGKGLDYSAFQVIDVSSMPYKQVAVYRDNMITPVEYAEVLNRVGKYYNECVILIEINDGVGEQISDLLHMDFEYENILFTENSDRSGKRISTGFGGKNIDKGVRTTKSVKASGCSMLKLLIEQEQLIINDFDTIQELSTFSRKGTSYEAESGKHDDLVMCLVLFGWLSDQRYFKEITDINTLAQLRNKTDMELMEELVPFGHIDDGTDSAISQDRSVIYFEDQDAGTGYRDTYSNLY